jgi:transposase
MILPAYKRGDLKAEQWKRIEPLLPPQKPVVGRPNNDHQQTINGILWVLRTGAPWRDVPEQYGCWQTVSGRFYRWQKQGVWQNILQALQQQADKEGKINWEIHFVDGSVIRAHQHAAGARRGKLDPNSTLAPIEQVQQREALGWSKGGFSTKIHLRCDGNGLPITFLVTVGERHETVVFEQLMEQGSVKRESVGRPRLRPHRVSGDKGYSSRKIRLYLRGRGIRYTIARKSNERRRGKFDKSLYRLRNLVERCFNRLKQFRRVATRYEKMAENYLSMLTLASIVLWL